MYGFTGNERKNLKFDENKRITNIISVFSFDWPHKNNPILYIKKTVLASYDGTVFSLIEVFNVKMELNIYHIKPGNFIVLFNQAFNKSKIVTKKQSDCFYWW